MRIRVLLALTGLLALLAGPATAQETPPPPKPISPLIAYTAFPYVIPTGATTGFLGPGDINLMRPDGTENRSLVTGPASDIEPEFSPDGQWVAFSSTRADVAAGVPDVWIVRVDGTGLRQVTKGMKTDGPSWSPDGTRIAVGTSGGIVVVDRRGGHLVQVTRNTGEHYDFVPTWTPDGKNLLFTRAALTDGHTSSESIWFANAGGGKAGHLLGGEGEFNYAQQPDVSPDGRYVVFAQAAGSLTSIHVADLQGNVLRRLVFSATGFLNGPTFSPDGRWVLFTHFGDGSTPSSLRRVSVDGTTTKLVAKVKHGTFYAPSWWSPTR